MFLVMTGVGIIIPCSQGAVMQPFPKITGTASGLFFFIQMMFGLGSGLIIQSFSANPSKLMALVILFSSLCLFVGFYFLIWQDRRNDSSLYELGPA
jgi:DHA1 family bicyclomycin/chloramphenicol resistance-like MFS transporter